jgi:hypothetical protein
VLFLLPLAAVTAKSPDERALPITRSPPAVAVAVATQASSAMRASAIVNLLFIVPPLLLVPSPSDVTTLVQVIGSTAIALMPLLD